MKKILLVLVLALSLSPVLGYAELQLGAAGMYNGDVTRLWFQPFDITWGMEGRLKFLKVLQVGLTGLYYTAPLGGGPSYIQALADAGLSLDVFFLRFGLGIGPDFVIPMSGPPVSAASNANMKLSGDVNIGPISVGLVAFYPVQSVWDLRSFSSVTPWVGFTAMLKIF